MVMVVNSALVRTHQSTYSGSFGPVLPPGWINCTRSAAVPLDVEGLTRPPLAAQCPLRRPGVGVVLLSHCWLWGRGGGWGRDTPPPCFLARVLRGRLRPPRFASVPMRYSPYAHWSHPYPLLRRATSAFVVVHVSDPRSRFLPWPLSSRYLVIPSLFTRSPQHPSFTPWFHMGGTFSVLGDYVSPQHPVNPPHPLHCHLLRPPQRHHTHCQQPRVSRRRCCTA